MQLAYDILKERDNIGNVTSVFLLSDGLDPGAEGKVKVLTN
jgi:hypothetical protein